MSNHIDMIIGRYGKVSLDDIVKDHREIHLSQNHSAIKNNPEESRRELFMWLFERAGKRNKNNTSYQFWQQNNHAWKSGTTRV